MHQNNTVYKGYRLSAKLERPAVVHAGDGRSPMFGATVVVGLASDTESAQSYEVPQFANGSLAFSPGEAVHAAILFGRQVVDSLQGKALGANASGSPAREASAVA